MSIIQPTPSSMPLVLLIVLFVTSAKLNLRPSPDGFASKCGMPHFVAFEWGNIKIAHRMVWGSQWGYPVQQLDISTSESQPEWCCKHSKKPSLQRRLWCFCGVFSGNVVSVCQWKMCVTSSDVGNRSAKWSKCIQMLDRNFWKTRCNSHNVFFGESSPKTSSNKFGYIYLFWIYQKLIKHSLWIYQILTLA